MDFIEAQNQLKELQERGISFLTNRKKAMIEFDKSGEIGDIDFFKKVLKVLKYKLDVEHEHDEDLNADVYWIGDSDCCIVHYKDKWIVDRDSYALDLDHTLNNPFCQFMIFDTRIDAAYGMNRVLADRKLFNFEHELYDTLEY